MIRIKDCSQNILGDTEVLNNIIDYIKQNVGRQDWPDHLDNIVGYVAAGICWHTDEVRGFMNSRLYRE